MCYGRMLDMRSDAAHKSVDTGSAAKDKAAGKETLGTNPGQTRDPSYARFMVRLERWLARASDRETSS